VAASATVGKAPVGHHFDNLRQQQATVRFGMWLFLVTEVMFFGGAFCAYTAYRYWFPREFEAGSAALNVGIASVNTFLLLASSLTMTLAIRACYVGNTKNLQMFLGLTIILGTAFLGLKMREYYLDYEEGLLPTNHMVSYYDRASGRFITESAFIESPVIEKIDDDGQPVYKKDSHGEIVTVGLRPALKSVGFKYVESGAGRTFEDIVAAEKMKEEAKARGEVLPEVDLHRVQLFFIFYYAMTGLHVIHMIIGIGLLGWQFFLAKFGFFDFSERYVYVEVMSLYWHFVDMVWMFLLPLLYLAGPHNWHQVGEGLKIAFNMAGHSAH
jgi:cytochrome c oxidase subunit 3